MRSIWRTVVSFGALSLLMTGCAVAKSDSPARIALLAPFEGRYREVGYDALYAARLAIGESGRDDITLLAVDDGGSVQTAAQRARALADDDLVKVVIVLGYDAAHMDVQSAFGDVPVLIVGNWNSTAASQNTFILSNPGIQDQLSVDSEISVTEAARLNAPVTGHEIFALQGFRQLRENLEDIAIISSGSLPEADFVERYVASDIFVEEPGLLASLTYDAVGMAIASIESSNSNREEIVNLLKATSYEGINGSISFESGYWIQAPINRFVYTSSGQLIQADDIIEER